MFILGGTIDCSAHGVPVPEINWHALGDRVREINPSWKPLPYRRDQSFPSHVSQPLIQVLTHNNSLHFRPFSPSEYQQNVHNTFYRCHARSESGVAISRRVRVRAGEFNMILK